MRKCILLMGVLVLGFCVSAMAQETPKAEIFGGYSYTRDVTDDQNFQGGTGSIAFNANNWLGLVGDFAGYKATGLPSGVSANLFTYTFGPAPLLSQERKGHSLRPRSVRRSTS